MNELDDWYIASGDRWLRRFADFEPESHLMTRHALNLNVRETQIISVESSATGV